MVVYERLGDTVSTLVIVLSIIGISYFFSARKKPITFLEWLGFKKPNRRSVMIGLAIGVGLFPVIVFLQSLEAMQSVMTAPTNSFYQLVEGKTSVWDGLAAAAVVGIFQTGFIEELFFRGFIGKRLFGSLPFWTANILQSLIFALVHAAFILAIEPPVLVGLFMFCLLPFGMGLAIGYLDEKVAEGSFVPGWVVHSSGNWLVYSYWVVQGI